MTDAAPIAETKPFSLPWPALWVFLACLLLALFCNAGALRGSGFIGAEQSLVRDNDLLNRLPGLQTLWFSSVAPSSYPLTQYSPLSQTLFFVEHAVWGDLLWPYRLTGVLLHACAGLMIWRLLRALSLPGAFAVAALFVAHPMTVDSVSWLVEQRNPLAALLALCGAFILLCAGGVIAPPPADARKLLPDDPLRLYAIGAALFILAFFANPALVATAPLAVLLIAWWKRHKPDALLTGTCVGLLIAGFAMVAVASAVEKSRADIPTQAAWYVAPSAAQELVVRSQIAGRAVEFYAQKLLFPFPIAVDYPRWQTPRDVEQFKTFTADPARAAARHEDVAPDQWLAYGFPLAVIVIIGASWALREAVGRGQVVIIAGFVLLLAPSLGFIDLGWMRHSFVVNGAAYLASVFVLTGMAWLAGLLLAMANDRTVTISSTVIAVAIFAVLSLTLSLRFRTAPYFWLQNANAIRDARSWWPRYELAASLLNVGGEAEYHQARAAIDEVRRIRPDEPAPLVMSGLLKQRVRDEADAVADFETCMQTFPAYAPAYFEAGDSFRILADAHPTDPKPRLQALTLFAEAAARDPFDVRSRVRLGRTSFEISKRLTPGDPSIIPYFDQAAASFDEAIQIRPYDVELLLEVSRTLIEMGKLKDASGLLESARSIAPDNAQTYVVIADAALARRDLGGADATLRAAIQNDPTLIEARLKLGALRQTQERWKDAREQFNKVLDLDPDSAEAKQRLKEIDAAATTRPGT